MTAAKKKEPEAPAPTPAPGSVTVGPLGRWDQIRTERMTITADQAAYILANHMPVNRPVIKGQRDKIIKVLQDGHWKFNGETIIFDREGHLKDGQHRLGACADTGISIDTLVVFGMEPDVFDTIGRCKPRDLKDDLGLEGEMDVFVLAACLRLIYAYESGERNRSLFSAANDSITLRAYLRDHPEIRKSAATAHQCNRDSGSYLPIAPRVVGACHYLFGLKDAGQRDKFFESLRSGIDLHDGDPILALRNRVFIDRSQASKVALIRRYIDTTYTQLNLVVRAWNAVRAGRKMAHINPGRSRVVKGKLTNPNIPEII